MAWPQHLPFILSVLLLLIVRTQIRSISYLSFHTPFVCCLFKILMVKADLEVLCCLPLNGNETPYDPNQVKHRWGNGHNKPSLLMFSFSMISQLSTPGQLSPSVVFAFKSWWMEVFTCLFKDVLAEKMVMFRLATFSTGLMNCADIT